MSKAILTTDHAHTTAAEQCATGTANGELTGITAVVAGEVDERRSLWLLVESNITRASTAAVRRSRADVLG